MREAREANGELAHATGKTLLAAGRGLDERSSALLAWCGSRGVDIERRGEAVESVRMGEVERGPPGKPYGHSASGSAVRSVCGRRRTGTRRRSDRPRCAIGSVASRAVDVTTSGDSYGRPLSTVRCGVHGGSDGSLFPGLLNSSVSDRIQPAC